MSEIKSSYELAMERLAKKDADAGVTIQPLTDQQKAVIAEVRSVYDAKVAEQDILQQSAMKNMMGADPSEVEEIGRRFRRERERLASERDGKLQALRDSAGS